MIRPDGFPGLPGGWDVFGGSFPAPSGKLQLYVGRLKRQIPKHRGRALLIVHGQGEHGGRYHHFPHYLDDTVDEIVLPDLRGHGRSEGVRGHVDRFDEYVEDLAAVIARETSGAEGRDLHLLGHSLGGLITLRLLRFSGILPLRSVALSAPLLRLAMKVPLWKHWGGLALARVQGSLPLPSAIDPKMVSHDIAVQRAYLEDRLNHPFASPRFYSEMLRVTEETRAWDEAVPYRVLFQIPQEDALVDSVATASFASRWKTERKKILTYPGFRHESYNELGKERAFGDLKEWIRENG